MLSLFAIVPLVATPMLAARCTGKAEETREEKLAKINEASKNIQVNYPNKENTDIFSTDVQNLIPSNIDLQKYDFNIAKSEINHKTNSINVEYFLILKSDPKIESEHKTIVLSDFGITSNYLNKLLTDSNTVMKLNEADNPDSGLETVKQMNAYYLVSGDGAIDVKLSNEKLFVPEAPDFYVTYQFDDANDTNKEFSGNVLLNVQLVYEKNGQKVISNSEEKLFEEALHPGFSSEFITKYKHLNVDLEGKADIPINSLKEGYLPEDLKAKMRFNLENKTVPETQEFFDKFGVTINEMEIRSIDVENRSIDMNLVINSTTNGNLWHDDFQVTISGFKEKTLADEATVTDFVNHLTFGDVHFSNKLASMSPEELNSLNIYYVPEGETLTTDSTIIDANTLLSKGIEPQDSNKIADITYDAENKILKASMTLNGHSYEVSTPQTHELNLENMVNEIGYETKEEKSEILANALNYSDFNFQNIDENKILTNLPFMRLITVYKDKTVDQNALYQEGKVQMVYKFRNIYTNEYFDHSIVLSGFKVPGDPSVVFKEQIANNTIYTGEFSEELINEIKAMNKNHDDLFGTLLFKYGKLVWGPSVKKAKKEFTGIKFSDDFEAAVHDKKVVTYIKKGNRKKLGFTIENNKLVIKFKVQDSDEILTIALEK